MTSYKRAILLKYGEVILKGFNKSYFEDLMIGNIKQKLRPIGKFYIEKEQSTLIVTATEDESLIDAAYEECKYIFGIATIAIAAIVDKDMEAIKACAKEYVPQFMRNCASFKCEGRRSDKRFPLNTPQICAEVGGAILEVMPGLRVDVRNPQCIVTIEIRDNNAFVRAGREIGACGLPRGSSGNGLLLLSGGIDSPVAGYMMAKRGLKLSALHFTSFPYTGERALDKTRELAGLVGRYAGEIQFMTVNMAHIQEEINRVCMEDFHIIILRRFMMEIACRVAHKTNNGCVITGESLGQVASQTLKAISVVDVLADMPVFRPLIGMDKQEITRISAAIGTYETSIQPFEDCSTVFTPKHPITKPRLEQVLDQEKGLDRAALIETALEGLKREIV